MYLHPIHDTVIYFSPESLPPALHEPESRELAHFCQESPTKHRN